MSCVCICGVESNVAVGGVLLGRLVGCGKETAHVTN